MCLFQELTESDFSSDDEERDIYGRKRVVVIDCLLESSPSSPEDNTDGEIFLRKHPIRSTVSVFSYSGESTIGSKRVSDSGDDYVDLTLDALTLTNSKPSLKYVQIEPLELAYISMEEIIRVCLIPSLSLSVL